MNQVQERRVLLVFSQYLNSNLFWGERAQFLKEDRMKTGHPIRLFNYNVFLILYMLLINMFCNMDILYNSCIKYN